MNTRFNYELVIINGIVQGAASYVITNGMLKFHQAPQLGDRITITLSNASIEHEGNGSRTVFEMPDNEGVKFELFMNKVWEHRNNSTVKDQLERLKVVMELIR